MNRQPIQRKTPMRRVSKKRAADSRNYAKQRKAFLESNPTCQLLCAEAHAYTLATEVHHAAKRGIRLNDERYWFSSCRACHDWLHSHGKESRSRGWIIDL